MHEDIARDGRDFLRQHQEAMVRDLGEFVERESPSTDKLLLDQFADFLTDYAVSAGGLPETIPMQETGNHVRVSWGPVGKQPPILLLGHFDTVWPQGTLQEMPFQVKNGMAMGPGIFDMKSGLVQGFWAVRAVREVAGVDRPVIFFCNSDEEIGSPTSRSLIEQEAARAAAVFVLEPSHKGALKTARKGVGIFHAELVGRPSHAGLDPSAGVSAIEELAHLTLDLHALSNRVTGTTVNVGVVAGGTRSNVVAANARAEIDLRVVTEAEADAMTRRILSWKPHHSEVQARLTGGMNRPPMERTEATVQLFRQAQKLADELGFGLDEVQVGGGSDGNFCAVLGVPVLDGLGAVGSGAHARDEHVLVDDMPLRAALVTRLLETV